MMSKQEDISLHGTESTPLRSLQTDEIKEESAGKFQSHFYFPDKSCRHFIMIKCSRSYLW